MDINRIAFAVGTYQSEVFFFGLASDLCLLALIVIILLLIAIGGSIHRSEASAALAPVNLVLTRDKGRIVPDFVVKDVIGFSSCHS
jgi:hypothetical protein